MALLREKKILVQYKFPEVSEEETKQIVNMWIRDVPIAEMARRLSPARVGRKQEPLIYVDLYSILFTLIQDKRIEARRSNRHELTVEDFCNFFRIWKQGGTERECLAIFQDAPEKLSSAKNVLRSTAERYRREQRRLAVGGPVVEQRFVQNQVLSFAVRKKVDGRPALVIFLEQIPIGLISQLRDVPGLAVQLDPKMLSSDEILRQINDAQPPDQIGRTAHNTTVPAGSAKELALLDPTGDLTVTGAERYAADQEEHAAHRRLKPRDPKPGDSPLELQPEIISDAELDARREESEDTPTDDGSQFSLENLLDDDDPDGDMNS